MESIGRRMPNVTSKKRQTKRSGIINKGAISKKFCPNHHNETEEPKVSRVFTSKTDKQINGIIN